MRLKKQVLEKRNRENYEFYVNEQAAIEKLKTDMIAMRPMLKRNILLERERNKLDVQLKILKADVKLKKKKKYEEWVYSIVFFAKYVLDNWKAQEEMKELKINIKREKELRQKIGKRFP